MRRGGYVYLASHEVLVDVLPNGSIRLESLEASMVSTRAQEQANFFSKGLYLVDVSGNVIDRYKT